MPKERNNGDGGLYWSEARQRWIAEATVGWTPAGKRRTRKAAGKTKTEAKKKLKDILDAISDGTATKADPHFTVADAVEDWLAFGLPSRDKSTLGKLRSLADNHVIPAIGKRKLTELTAEEVDEWLAGKAAVLSTRTLRDVRSIPLRAINRAQAREKVRRNVVLLCECPRGRTAGRRNPSHSRRLTRSWRLRKRRTPRSVRTSCSRC